MARSHRFVRKDPDLARSNLRCACTIMTAIILLSSVSAPSLFAAVSSDTNQGPPAKVASGAAVAEDANSGFWHINLFPWRKKKAQSTVLEVDQPKPASVAMSSKPSTTLWNSYLPSAGPAPLRFSSSRSWPDAMPTREKAALAIALAPDPDLGLASPKSDTASASGTDGATALTAAPQVVTTYSASSADAAAPQRVVDRQPIFVQREYILTSDLVLNSLGNLSNDSAAVPTQFRPATPAVTSYESVPVAAAP